MLVEKMLEYVTWEQVLIVLFVGLWLIRTIQVLLLRTRLARVRRHWGEEVDELTDQLEDERMENSALRAKLQTVLDEETWERFKDEFLEEPVE